MNALLTLKIISPKIKKNTRNSQFNYENKIVKIQIFAQFYKMNTSFYLYQEEVAGSYYYLFKDFLKLTY